MAKRKTTKKSTRTGASKRTGGAAKKTTKSTTRSAKPATATTARSTTSRRPRKTPTLTPSSGNGGVTGRHDLVTPTPDQIAKRAYEIWVAKGRPVGQDEQNWREAETELMSAAQ